MSKYSELKAKCEALNKEFETMNPDEIWVCFYMDKSYLPEVIFSEEEAQSHYPNIREKILRYVLATPEPAKPIEEPKTT